MYCMTPDQARQISDALLTREPIPGLEVTELPAGEGWLMFQLECKLAEWEDTEPMGLE